MDLYSESAKLVCRMKTVMEARLWKHLLSDYGKYFFTHK